MLTMLRYFNFFSFCHKTVSYFQNIDMIFQGSINDHIKIPHAKFQVCVIWFGLQTLSKLTKDIQQKTPKKSKNSHNQIKSQNFQKQKVAFLGFHSRIPHAKNQHPTTKTVTCRADKERQTDTHTNRQRQQKQKDLSIFFGHFFS